MNQPLLKLPGISEETRNRAGIQHVDAETALKLCGRRAAGTIIPYFDIHGDRIEEGEGEFVRLRLDEPQGGQKYHQRAGSAVHGYLPPSICKDQNIANPIVVIEGEKKALALSDAGFSAVGISGFYCFCDRSGALVPELGDVLTRMCDPLVIYVGDQDTVFNPQFADAAVELATLVPKAKVLVVCIPLSAPGKGIDDVRAALGAKFHKWWFTHQFLGCYTTCDSDPGKLAVELLEVELKRLPEPIGEDVLRGVAKLAAGLKNDPLIHGRLIELAQKYSNQGRAAIKKLFKLAAEERRASVGLSDLGIDPLSAVDLDQPAALWTEALMRVIGPVTFFYGDNLCKVFDGKFVPFKPASLVPFCDDPQRCTFIQRTAGGLKKARFTEAQGRLALAAIRQHGDILRPVEVISAVPVLAWTGKEAQLIHGYDRETKIFAGETDIQMPAPEEAVRRVLEILRDFDFATAGDAGRALAFLVTPALSLGGFLGEERSPFFLIEKDQCGAGGGTLARLLAAIYHIKPASITPDDPKSAREDISRHLLAGANFIYFDNIRGKILANLEFFESLLTEPVFTCRAPYVHGEVRVVPSVFAGTSNGAVLSRDLAARTVKIAIKKQADGYGFHRWPQGKLFDHVAAHRAELLGAIYALVKAWADKGRPAGKGITGFRFSAWESACCWILEECFFRDLSLLDEAHRHAQKRMANPDFELLRTVLRTAWERGLIEVAAGKLAELADEAGLLEAKGNGGALRMGRILKREFSAPGMFQFAGEFMITRSDIHSRATDYDTLTRYSIAPVAPCQTPPSPGPTADHLTAK